MYQLPDMSGNYLPVSLNHEEVWETAPSREEAKFKSIQ